MYYDINGQKERCNEINKLVIDKYITEIETDEISKRFERLGLKEITWLSMAFWNTDKVFAQITEKMIIGHSHLDGFHTFLSFMFIVNLIRNKERMSLKLINCLEDYVRRNIHLNLLDTWDFMGVNDNTPAMIAAALILAGEYFSEEKAFVTGKKRLEDLRTLLTRRALLSEFNSPAYTPITLYAVAAVAEYSVGIKELALELEAKLWQQTFQFYYPPVSNNVGPYSRAYERDKRLYTHNNRFVLYALLGDFLKVNAKNTVFSSDYKCGDHERFYMQIANVWLCNMNYHCPKETVNNFINRKYPYFYAGNAEVSSSHDKPLLDFIGHDLRERNLTRQDIENVKESDNLFEYPCTVSIISAYMEENYAMGTSVHEFHNGSQTDSFSMVFEAQNEIGAVFSNYCINKDYSLTIDMGRKIAFQSEDTAMVLYRPKPIGELVKSAKLDIIFTNHKNTIKKIHIKDHDNFRLDEKIPLNNIYFELEYLYICVIPLINDNAFIKISEKEDCLLLELYNYEDNTGRTFKKKELAMLTNGFIFKVSRKENSFGDFCDFEYQLNDELICNPHNRYTYMRNIYYKDKKNELECCYNPIGGGIKFISVNEKVIV